MGLLQSFWQLFQKTPDPVVPHTVEEEETPMIRWAEESDLPGLLWVENHSDLPVIWSWKEFQGVLRDRKFRTIVVSYKDVILGYLTCRRYRGSLILWSQVTHRNWLRQGVGLTLIETAKNFPEPKWHKDHLLCHVRESNLVGQQFLRACGFTCTGVVEEGYETPPEPAYIFEWFRTSHPPE